MKKLTLALLAIAGLIMVGCGGKSGSSAGTPTNPSDPGISGGGLCQPWQVYTTQYGCLDQRLDRCQGGMGYHPETGACIPGTLGGGQIAQGYWQQNITVVDIAQYQALLKDQGQCYQSTCPISNWMLFTLNTTNSTYATNGGASFMPWYGGSSAAQFDQAANFAYPQSQFARVNMISQGSGYWGRMTNLQISAQARPTQTGFEMVQYTRLNNFGRQADNKKIQVIATYVDAARAQLKIQVVYQNKLVAEGVITKQ